MAVFAGETLVKIFGWEAVVGAALEGEPPEILVVIVPPPVCGTGIPPSVPGAVDPLRGFAEFAGEILVVIFPRLLSV